jgi:Na+-driven multidrug efflux pump
VETLVQQPFNSLGLVVSTFAGQNAGAGQYDLVKTDVKSGELGAGASGEMGDKSSC